MSKKRKGRQTPTVWITQPYKRSRMKECIALYETSGRKAQNWQKNIVKDLLAVDSKGRWIHTRYGYSVPRRNGKNEVIAMIELFGIINGESILHTAHRVNTSSEASRRLAMILKECGYVEIQREKSGEKYEKAFKYIKQVGAEKITILDEGGGSVSFRTRTDNGGLGEGFDLLIIDEAQEYTESQETALKYIVTASKNPHMIFLGTPPTAISGGTVFQEFRNTLIKEKKKRSGWAEWSITEECDPHNVDAWYETNPSLGTTLMEETIEDEIGTTEEAIRDFNIQRLGLWIFYNMASAISQKQWKLTEADKYPSLTGKLFVGVKYGSNGMNTAMSIACKTTDGRIFVSAYDCRSRIEGDDWILNFLQNSSSVEAVVADGKVGVEELTTSMKKRKLGKLVMPSNVEFLMASSLFEKAVFNETIWHLPQMSLDDVVTNCEKKPYGHSGGFVYKALINTMDICIFDSIMLAHWACVTHKPKVGQKVQY